MQFAADQSQTLEVFYTINRWHKRPSLRFSVSCLWNGDCAGTRALCWMVFETKSVIQTQRNCGPMPWPPRSPDITPLDFFLYQECDLGYSSGHAPQNIVWTFSVLLKEATLRSTEVSKNLPEFHYDLPQTALASLICLRSTIFQIPEGTLWTHCIMVASMSLENVRKLKKNWTKETRPIFTKHLRPIYSRNAVSFSSEYVIFSFRI
jgi:hypothetical protein